MEFALFLSLPQDAEEGKNKQTKISLTEHVVWRLRESLGKCACWKDQPVPNPGLYFKEMRRWEYKESNLIVLVTQHSNTDFWVYDCLLFYCVNFFQKIILFMDISLPSPTFTLPSHEDTMLFFNLLFLHTRLPWKIRIVIDFPTLKGISKCYSNSAIKSLDSHSNVFCRQVCFIAFSSGVLFFFYFMGLFLKLHQFAQCKEALVFQADSADGFWENVL